MLTHCITEAFSSLRRERRRLLPMALGIIWGMASVMVLLAVASGFERSQRRVLGAYGDRFVFLRLNRAELDRAAGMKERRLMMLADDIDRLREGAPAIRRLSPMNMVYRARITGRNGAGSNSYIAGALPEIALMRNLPLAEGRFYDEIDEADRRRVIVLGPLMRQQLFGAGPAIGRTIRIAGYSRSQIQARVPGGGPQAAVSATRSSGTMTASTPGLGLLGAVSTPGTPTPAPRRSEAAAAAVSAAGQDHRIAGEIFEVIGVLADVEIQRESYVSVARLGFIPFSTSQAVFDRDFNTILIEPRSLEDKDLALRQFREVMGARFGFAPDDRNAVVIYFDAIERAQQITAIFGALRLFLSVVGALILAIGAIGVMNVVLASVAARRYEIGLRKALGATPLVIYAQFFTETVLGCFLSGAVGFLLGILGIALLGVVPLPEGLSRPAFDLRTAGLAFGLLTLVAVTAGVYPARRASALPPVEALRARG